MSSDVDAALDQPHSRLDPLKQFCELYSAIEPRKICSTEESVLLSQEAGLSRLSNAPVGGQVAFVTDMPRSRDEAATARHLWAICPVEVRYALEATPLGELEAIKHSNLTAAGPAFCAGEVWFIGENRFGFNGNSGRYGVEDPDMLKDLEDLFIGLGYTVASTGFDYDAGRCMPHFTEDEIQWRNEV